MASFISKTALAFDLSCSPPSQDIALNAPNLEQQHQTENISITAENLISLTDDVRMDIDMVMDGLLACDDKLRLKQLIVMREQARAEQLRDA